METHEPEFWRTPLEDGEICKDTVPAEVCGTCSRQTGTWVPVVFCPIAKEKSK